MLVVLLQSNAAHGVIIHYEYIGQGHGAGIGSITDQKSVRAVVAVDSSIDGQLINPSLLTTDFPYAVLSMVVEVDGHTFASHPMATLPADTDLDPYAVNYVRMYNYNSSTGPATTLHLVTYGQDDVTEMAMMLIDKDNIIDSPIIPTDLSGVEELTNLNVRIGGELFAAWGELRVIPEPASLALLGAGGLLLLRRRRPAMA